MKRLNPFTLLPTVCTKPLSLTPHQDWLLAPVLVIEVLFSALGLWNIRLRVYIKYFLGFLANWDHVLAMGGTGGSLKGEVGRTREDTLADSVLDLPPTAAHI